MIHSSSLLILQHSLCDGCSHFAYAKGHCVPHHLQLPYPLWCCCVGASVTVPHLLWGKRRQMYITLFFFPLVVILWSDASGLHIFILLHHEKHTKQPSTPPGICIKPQQLSWHLSGEPSESSISTEPVLVSTVYWGVALVSANQHFLMPCHPLSWRIHRRYQV